MANYESKILKRKVLDKELRLKVSQNEMSGRIFVEFSTENGNMVVQKSFQDTYEGKLEAESFQKSMKNIRDFKKYLGIK